MPENTKPAVASGWHRELIVSEWKPFEKNTLRGFLSLILPSGLVIHDITLHEKNGRRWFNMAARPYKDGKDGWQPLVEFSSRDVRDRFQAMALAAIDKYLAGGFHDE